MASGHGTDWLFESKESITARLQAVNESQSRARRTIVVMAVVSAMTFFAAWNAYLSYDFKWAIDQKVEPFRPDRNSPDILREHAIKSWADSRNVGVSLLGIRASIDDAPILAAGTLALMGIWLLLAIRRENHTIGFLLRDTNQNPVGAKPIDLERFRELRWLIFHSIVSNTLITNFNVSLARIRTLDGPNPTDAAEDNSFWTRLQGILFGTISALFIYFPVIVVGVVFVMDRMSYHRESPFRHDDAPPGIGEFYRVSGIIFIPLWLLLGTVCWGGWRYANATQCLLKEYYTQLRKDRDQVQVELAAVTPDVVPTVSKLPPSLNLPAG